ncbi:hypothetical protein D3C85_313390 [compost metagenome]
MTQKKIAALVSVVLLLTAFIDTYFDLLKNTRLGLELINQIKLVGLLVSFLFPGVAALFPSKNK